LLILVVATAMAEAGQIALALDLTLILKSAANFAFTLNASLLFVIAMTMVVMALTHGSA